MVRRWLFVFALVVIVLVVLGCSSRTTPAVSEVVIEQGDVVLVVGQTVELSVTVRAVGGASTEVTWVSSDEAVATVSGAGVVTGVAEGEATVVATSAFDDSRSGSIAVSVVATGNGDPVGVSVSVEPFAALLAPGGEQSFTASVEGADDPGVVWRATGGTLSVDGDTVVYTAPDEPGDHRVVATSVAHPERYGTGFVTVAAVPEVPPSIVVVIASDEVLLTAAGQQASLRAVVYEDGVPQPAAEVVWLSSDPAVVSVTSDGVVTALEDVGSAVVTVSYGAESDQQLVAIAQPAAAARVVVRDDVRGIGIVGDEIVEVRLDRTAANEALAAGEVIVSNAGILSRVTGVTLVGDEVVVAVEAATLEDAFEELSLEGVASLGSVEVSLSAQGVRVMSSDAAVVSPQQVFSLSRLQCESEFGVEVELDIVDGEISYSFQPEFTASYSDSWLSKPRFLVQVEAKPRLNVVSPTLVLSGGFGGEYHCSLRIAESRIPVFSFFGLLAVSGNFTPIIGFYLRGEVDAGEFVFAGPFIRDVGFDAKLGFEHHDGFEIIRDAQFVPGEYGIGSFDVATQPSVSLELEPYLDLGLGVSIDVTVIKGVGVDVAKPRLYTTFAFDAAGPFDVTDPDYGGPNWRATLAAEASFGVKLTGAVATALRYMGVEVDLEAETYDLFSPREYLRSPRLRVAAHPRLVTSSVSLSVSDIDSRLFGGDEVRFYALPSGGGDAMLVGSSNVSTTGSAAVEWTPTAALNGAYYMRAALYDSVFGAVGFPYVTAARGLPVIVNVAATDVAVSVEPSSVTLPVNGTQSFTATVTGASDTSVTWTASCGGITGSGNTITYTAPATAGDCDVTATSVADPAASATARVTVTATPVDGFPTVLAASAGPSHLYEVELCADGGDTLIGSIGLTITDIATCADGVHYGVSDEPWAFSGRRSRLFVIDAETAEATLIGATGTWVNSLECGPDGVLFAGGFDNLWQVDRSNGQASLIGRTGRGDFSGDIVFAPDGTLYGTVTESGHDVLITIDPTTGVGEPLGTIGFELVYGLSYADDRLFGLTADAGGLLIEIDIATGEGSLLRSLSFEAYGATALESE